MNTNKTAFKQAKKVIPGGVNSPVRAFKGVGGDPIFIKKADGCWLYDIEGKSYIDYVGSWGPMIMGHNHPVIRDAIIEAAHNGVSFGAPTELETQLAEKIKQHVPSMDKVRFVNSGTEATMSALRLARAYTGRDLIAKFEGCYHGHADALLVKGGSGMLTHGEPNSPGVPKEFTDLTLVFEFNNIENLRANFNEYGERLAAIIIEPVAGNMNCIPAEKEFIEELAILCKKNGTLLIFDEVMSGFRVSIGGAQRLYGINPDLTCLGKIIGGGLPVGAFGGKEEIMEMLSPMGAVYQAGTLSGNPLCMSAGLKMLELIEEENVYEHLFNQCNRLCDGILMAAKKNNVPMSCNRAGAMFGLFFGSSEQVSRFSQVASGVQLYNFFFHEMLREGFYFAPSAYEAGFICSAHSDEDIDATIIAAEKALVAIKDRFSV